MITLAPDVVARCLRNDAAAQKQLYDAYAPHMMGVCYRYTRSMDEASDVLQEGFVRVFRSLHQYQGQGELGAWIRRIMVNAALNWLRDHRKMTWLPEDHAPEQSPYQPAVLTPEQLLDARQVTDLIRALPPGYQTVFNLHAVEGYTHVEIAQLLGISEGTSRSQYLRARRMLAEKIHHHHQLKQQAYAGRK